MRKPESRNVGDRRTKNGGGGGGARRVTQIVGCNQSQDAPTRASNKRSVPRRPAAVQKSEATFVQQIRAAHARLLLLKTDSRPCLANLIGNDTETFLWVEGLRGPVKGNAKVSLRIRGARSKNVARAAQIVQAVFHDAQLVKLRTGLGCGGDACSSVGRRQVVATAAGGQQRTVGGSALLRKVQAESGASVHVVAVSSSSAKSSGLDEMDDTDAPLEICGSPRAVLRAMYLLQQQ